MGQRMTKAEFEKVINFLTVGIGKPIGGSGEAKERMQVYYDLLGDLPAEVLAIAAKRVLYEHVWNTFPSVAELAQAALKVLMANDLTSAEAWQLAWTAACRIDPEIQGPYIVNGKRFANQAEAEMSKLPPMVKESMLRFGVTALIDANPNFVRTSFMKVYEGMVEQRKNHAIADGAKKQVASASVKALLPTIGKAVDDE